MISNSSSLSHNQLQKFYHTTRILSVSLTLHMASPPVYLVQNYHYHHSLAKISILQFLNMYAILFDNLPCHSSSSVPKIPSQYQISHKLNLESIPKYHIYNTMAKTEGLLVKISEIQQANARILKLIKMLLLVFTISQLHICIPFLFSFSILSIFWDIYLVMTFIHESSKALVSRLFEVNLTLLGKIIQGGNLGAPNFHHCFSHSSFCSVKLIFCLFTINLPRECCKILFLFFKRYWCMQFK